MREKTYLKHLKELRGIKFTAREIDIASCVLCNRGEKKIASLLFISSKTVNAHIYNIMQKLQCNSRDHIIDFLEKSGKLQLIHEYYLHLLLESNFKKQLIKIGKQINRQQITYKIGIQQNILEENWFLNKLRQYLKLANIDLQTTHNDSCNIYEDLKKIPEEQYYLSVLKFLRNLINKIEIDQIIEEFTQQYIAINMLLAGKSLPEQDYNVPLKIKEKKSLNIRKLFFGIIVFILNVTIGIFILNYYLMFTKPDLTLISKINADIAKFAKDFTADNTTKAKIQKNHILVKEVEKIINQTKKSRMDSYFTNGEASSNELLNYLYSLQALSSYYLYNDHDGEKARELLKYGKDLAENYVIRRSRLKFGFDKLNNNEIYIELSIIKDLPEIYTRIIYSLGRTHLYQGNNEKALGYFELSKFLGSKLGIFEGYLSIISGIEVVKERQVDIYIKNGAYDVAEQKIYESVRIYKELKYDNKEYKLDFKPGDEQPATIIPKENIYNQVECSLKIINYYNKLIKIPNNKVKKAEYIKEISDQFIGTDQSSGILLLKQLQELANKKIACIYNILGNTLLHCYDEYIDYRKLKSYIVKQLKLSEGNDLEIIYQIFNLAESISRSTDYTKADSYEGLIEVYTRRINQGILVPEEKDKLLLKIQELLRKTNYLNEQLKRKDKPKFR